mgnify:CR=1 FL=1
MKFNYTLKSLTFVLVGLGLTACSSVDNTSVEENAVFEERLKNLGTHRQAGVKVSKVRLEQPIASSLNSRNSNFVNSDAASLLVYFSFDSTILPLGISDVLDPHVRYLNDHPYVRVTLEGHTDAVGTPEYNIALGEKRAKKVEQYLIDRGVMQSQLTTVSYGEEKRASRLEPSKNRRAVITYR